jgi:hypothetical protein
MNDNDEHVHQHDDYIRQHDKLPVCHLGDEAGGPIFHFDEVKFFNEMQCSS